jgi:hypothetical protein
MNDEDYPRTVLEFEERFASEEACREYLFQLRWPEGFRCPHCGGARTWETKRGLYRCTRCDVQVSLTAGTIFQDTHKPLRLWFRALWYVTNQKHGVSALGLQRVLGLGSYRTAWTWLHKLRHAMVRPGRDRLSGTVEVDETYIGAASGFSVGSPQMLCFLVSLRSLALAPGPCSWGLCPQTPRIYRLMARAAPATIPVPLRATRPKRSSPLFSGAAALASKAENPRGSGGLVPQVRDHKM